MTVLAALAQGSFHLQPLFAALALGGFYLLANTLCVWGGVRLQTDSTGRSAKALLLLHLVELSVALLLILALSLLLDKYSMPVSQCLWLDLWGPAYLSALLLTGVGCFLLWGIGALLQIQMAPLAQDVSEEKRKGVIRGGKTIGMLERTLVLLFVLAAKPEGVAFVVVAKSVFRIGELNNKEDRVYAEYIMIGTLSSFTYALVTAFVLKWYLGVLN